jgi:hypothetical protein
MAAAVENVYALDVGDVPVLTFAATTFREAQSLCREQWLRTDLTEAHSNGAPVWDGKSKLTVRRASADETARFHSAIAEAVDDSGDLVLVYLIELDK